MKLWEWLALLAILGIGAWLRFSRLDLLEFKSDEAVASWLALRFVKGGILPLTGLMSSVGVTNPPLFIYLLIPMFAINMNPVFVSCCIAVLGLGAVAACWHIGRKYYGAVAGVVCAAMFAVSPWAVIYSRKIWAQDFVPLFSTGAMWAVHALVVGKRPKAIFWALFLPLCVIQIHFSGLALTATVVAILLLLQPKINWRFAAAGVMLAVLVALPYLKFQIENHWVDFHKAAAMAGRQNYHIPDGMTVHPDSGYALPRRNCWVHALSILNAGQIEDVLGLSTRANLDPNRVWPTTRGVTARYFEDTLRLGNWVLVLERIAFGIALVWLAVCAVRSLRRSNSFPFVRIEDGQGVQTAWILTLWIVLPLGVFVGARLWTYLSYFIILYPAHFLVLGAMTQTLAANVKTAARLAVYGTVTAVLVWNVAFVADFYRFLDQYGGAHGTYGTVLAQKHDAARFLASRADVQQLTSEGRLWQVDRLIQATPTERVLLTERPQLDLPFLAMMKNKTRAANLPTNTVIFVTDNNRTNFEPRQWAQYRVVVAEPHGDHMNLMLLPLNAVAGVTLTNFGPMWVFIASR